MQEGALAEATEGATVEDDIAVLDMDMSSKGKKKKKKKVQEGLSAQHLVVLGTSPRAASDAGPLNSCSDCHRLPGSQSLRVPGPWR